MEVTGHAALSVPPGLCIANAAGLEPQKSGACTPDFLAARARPSKHAGDAAMYVEGTATPRDTPESAAYLTVEQLNCKLQELEVHGYHAAAAKLSYPPATRQPAAPQVPPVPARWHRAAGPGAPPTEEPAKVSPLMPPPPPPPPAHDASARAVAVGQRRQAPKFVVSVGSVGHPTQCAEMCQQDACEQGSLCARCHLCRAEQVAEQVKLVAEIDAMTKCPSVGSMGHPKACGQACKFFYKTRGCKDGSLCTRCHVCRWNRYRNHPRGRKGLADAPLEGEESE